jgi:hypothetical protein
MKNQTYPIDGDTADNITRIVLGEAVKNLKADDKRLKKEIKALKDAPAYLYEDLNDNMKYLQALELAHQYFGGK